MAKKSKKSAKAAELEITPIEAETEPTSESEAPVPVPTAGVEDPLGEPADGEGRVYLGDEDALDSSKSAVAEAKAEEVDEETAPEPAAPQKLERLQKILSQAGIASRRRAEELITEGRVQVNGTVVTELGTKADPARDHIRVDGKLLHGAERHRYFVLNKPKGYVTTVSDPEGRPTVMTFFEKMRERLYPVGRLDYLSEGLLLVTNDGELANQLTKAASGVEKTYLVKVAGQPSEEELDKLRGGVAIDRSQPGSGKVHTAPARIRQVRQGDNPWYEVVLIEGRNRELRKMFSSIGHFVEKIRRVGYGPLVLDLEPGKLRELVPEELAKLRLAAEGKWHAPKPKEPKQFERRERGRSEFSKPARAPRSESNERFERRDRSERSTESRRGEFRPKRTFGGDRQFRGEHQERGEFRPKRTFGAGKPFSGERPERSGFRSRNESGNRKPTGRFEDRPFRGKPRGGKPDWKKSGDTRRPSGERRFERPERAEHRGRDRAGFERTEGERPRFSRPKFDKPRSDKPRFDRRKFDTAGSDRPARREFSKPPLKREWGTEERPQRKSEEAERPKFTERAPKRPGGPRPGGRPFRPGNQGGVRSQSRSFGKPGGKSPGFKNRGGGVGRGGPRPGGKRRP